MSYLTRIVISDNVQELTGKGTEYLLDKNGEIIAKFESGMMVCACAVIAKGNLEATVTAA